MTIEIPPAGKYDIIAEQSEIRFSTKHRFGTGTVRGRFELIGGTMVVDDPTSRSSISVAADPASFSSGNASRDAKVRSATFLDTASYPRMTFTSHAVENVADGSWQLQGALDAHGVTVPTTFVITEARSIDDSVDLVAVGSVDRYAHGVQAMKGMAGRRLDLTIRLHADRT